MEPDNRVRRRTRRKRRQTIRFMDVYVNQNAGDSFDDSYFDDVEPRKKKIKKVVPKPKKSKRSVAETESKKALMERETSEKLSLILKERKNVKLEWLLNIEDQLVQKRCIFKRLSSQDPWIWNRRRRDGPILTWEEFVQTDIISFDKFFSSFPKSCPSDLIPYFDFHESRKTMTSWSVEEFKDFIARYFFSCTSMKEALGSQPEDDLFKICIKIINEETEFDLKTFLDNIFDCSKLYEPPKKRIFLMMAPISKRLPREVSTMIQEINSRLRLEERTEVDRQNEEAHSVFETTFREFYPNLALIPQPKRPNSLSFAICRREPSGAGSTNQVVGMLEAIQTGALDALIKTHGTKCFLGRERTFVNTRKKQLGLIKSFKSGSSYKLRLSDANDLQMALRDFSQNLRKFFVKKVDLSGRNYIKQTKSGEIFTDLRSALAGGAFDPVLIKEGYNVFKSFPAEINIRMRYLFVHQFIPFNEVNVVGSYEMEKEPEIAVEGEKVEIKDEVVESRGTTDAESVSIRTSQDTKGNEAMDEIDTEDEEDTDPVMKNEIYVKEDDSPKDEQDIAENKPESLNGIEHEDTELKQDEPEHNADFSKSMIQKWFEEHEEDIRFDPNMGSFTRSSESEKALEVEKKLSNIEVEFSELLENKRMDDFLLFFGSLPFSFKNSWVKLANKRILQLRTEIAAANPSSFDSLRTFTPLEQQVREYVVASGRSRKRQSVQIGSSICVFINDFIIDDLSGTATGDAFELLGTFVVLISKALLHAETLDRMSVADQNPIPKFDEILDESRPNPIVTLDRDLVEKVRIMFPEGMEKEFQETLRLTYMLKLARKYRFTTCVFTGAGIGTGKGANLPTVRGDSKAIQEKGKPFDPSLLEDARPTSSHMVIKALVEKGYVHFVCTQNIENLHRTSGLRPPQLWEVHGNIFDFHCSNCETVFDEDSEKPPDDMLCPICSKARKDDWTEILETKVKMSSTQALKLASDSSAKFTRHSGSLRRSVVRHYGENIVPPDYARNILAKMKCCIVVGSSLRVGKIAHFVCPSMERSRPLLGIVNIGPTKPKCDFWATQKGVRLDTACDRVFEAVAVLLKLDYDKNPPKCRRKIITERGETELDLERIFFGERRVSKKM